MSDSVPITLSNSAWTDISSGAANGLVTNQSNYPIIIQEALNDPGGADLSGHTVFAGPNGFFNWAGITTTIWARAVPLVPAPIQCEVTPQ